MKWHGPPQSSCTAVEPSFGLVRTSNIASDLHASLWDKSGLYIEVIEIETAQNPGRFGFSLVLYE